MIVLAAELYWASEGVAYDQPPQHSLRPVPVHHPFATRSVNGTRSITISNLRPEIRFPYNGTYATNGGVRGIVGHANRKTRRLGEPLVQSAQERTAARQEDAIGSDVG